MQVVHDILSNYLHKKLVVCASAYCIMKSKWHFLLCRVWRNMKMNKWVDGPSAYQLDSTFFFLFFMNLHFYLVFLCDVLLYHF